MSSEAHVDHPESESHDAHHSDHSSHYIRIYFLLLFLLVVSILGPELEIRVVTLITAFGIAVVKAYLVAKHFMHLNIEKTFIVYLMVTCLALMMLFFFGTAPDVMKHWGANWENVAAPNMSKTIHSSEHHDAAAATHAGAEGHAPAEGHAAPTAEKVEAKGEHK
jgi:caa(3)-type oxidase subunit IV